MTVQHIFSVEVDENKRQFILAAHTSKDGKCAHLFDDVEIFNNKTTKEHFCYSCGKAHPIPSSVDVLASGPSCKNMSKMFSDRKMYSECFLVQRLRMALERWARDGFEHFCWLVSLISKVQDRTTGPREGS